MPIDLIITGFFSDDAFESKKLMCATEHTDDLRRVILTTILFEFARLAVGISYHERCYCKCQQLSQLLKFQFLKD